MPLFKGNHLWVIWTMWSEHKFWTCFFERKEEIQCVICKWGPHYHTLPFFSITYRSVWQTTSFMWPPGQKLLYHEMKVWLWPWKLEMFQIALHQRLRENKFSYCTKYCEVYRINEFEQRAGPENNIGIGNLVCTFISIFIFLSNKVKWIFSQFIFGFVN